MSIPVVIRTRNLRLRRPGLQVGHDLRKALAGKGFRQQRHSLDPFHSFQILRCFARLLKDSVPTSVPSRVVNNVPRFGRVAVRCGPGLLTLLQYPFGREVRASAGPEGNRAYLRGRFRWAMRGSPDARYTDALRRRTTVAGVGHRRSLRPI